MNILVTGGSGLLGSYLLPLLKEQDGDGTLMPRVQFDAPTHEEMDITKPETLPDKRYDVVLHLAAFTDVVAAEDEKYNECLDVNVEGTLNLIKKYPDARFVFLSSEYASEPVNKYGLSKQLAEMAITSTVDKFLIIRTLFKPVPFPFDKAFIDAFTQGDEVPIIAKLIAQEVVNWGGDSKIIYVGTGRKTIYDIAVKSRPDVGKISVNDVVGVTIPKDYE